MRSKLTAEIETIQSGEDWRRMLDVAARLHQYSAANLIAMQHAAAYREGRVPTPAPMYVAGFHAWKALGRSVDRGQKGYAVTGPACALAAEPTRSCAAMSCGHLRSARRLADADRLILPGIEIKMTRKSKGKARVSGLFKFSDRIFYSVNPRSGQVQTR